MDNVATKATNWLEKWLDMFKQSDDKPTTETKYKNRKNWFLENTPSRKGNDTLYDVWLRDCEKVIADHLGMSEAWVHISINGDFLC